MTTSIFAKKLILTFLSILFLVAPLVAQETIPYKINELTKNSHQLQETERMNRLAKLHLDYQLQAYPEFGTYIGQPTDNSQWTNFSMAAIEQRKKDNNMFLRAIQSIQRSSLNAADQLNYDLLKNTFELNKEGQAFPSELMPINQMSGYHQEIVQIAGITTFSKQKDIDDFLARLAHIPTLVDQLITLMDRGIQQGIVPPKTTLLGVPEQIQNIIGNDPASSPLLFNLTDYLKKQPATLSSSISGKAIKIIAEQVNPAFKKLKLYFEKTYIPKARQSIALKELKNGENWYNYNIKVRTTTTLTYQQIHDIGLREVKRIRIAMDSLIKTTGFKGSFEEFSEFLKTDPQFFYTDSIQLLNGYRVIAKKSDAELPRFFGKLPRLTYGVVPVAEYDEKFQTTAYYMPGSAKAGRAGLFYANTYDLPSRPKWEMEALTLHEAVPGHHLQVALAQELENVPEFRQYSRYTAFSEGWGLYSESLGSELGFYQDPYSKFGQLTYEVWRAIRLVLDTGMHGLGWTRQQAINYFKSNSAKTEHDIRVEVDRYIAWPGQALAYKIGELKIKELRAKAQRILGDQFDIRAFHDTVLANGAVPLSVLDQKVNAWIDAIK